MTRILVVEDEMTLRLAIRWQLENLQVPDPPVDVIDKKNFREAKLVLESSHAFHVAIIDLRLSGPDGIDNNAGFEVIELLARQSPPVPVVILTARNDSEAHQRVTSLPNVRSFIQKPWASHKLQEQTLRCLTSEDVATIFIGESEDFESCE